ncbi:MAG: hypothetical protein WC657_06615 [Candidatus Paceibacterota bacterium]
MREETLKSYWSWAAGGKNFGDQLTPFLFKEICGVELQRVKEPRGAELFACGSIGELIPDWYTGVVLGTGMMYEDTRKNLRQARVLALRGKGSLAISQVENVLLGDFGLAMRCIMPKSHPKHGVGEIPHHVIFEAEKGMFTTNFVIDLKQEPRKVIEQAAECRKIVSSSLHGLVLADCLGVENMWLPDKRVEGDGFKFRDYASAFGEEIKPNEWRLAPQEKVDEIAEKLVALMKGLTLEHQSCRVS